MALTKMLVAIGNSHGIILDKPILQMLGWDENTWVVMRADGYSIIVRRATEDEARQAVDDERLLGVDGGSATASGTDTPANPKERTGVADD
jgi:hypothetical protein